MFVAAAKITLDFWGNEELRDKKKLIEALSLSLEKAHQVPLNEVEAFEDLEKCVLGLSFCSTDRESARRRMEKLVLFIDEHSAARVVSEEVDFIDFG